MVFTRFLTALPVLWLSACALSNERDPEREVVTVGAAGEPASEAMPATRAPSAAPSQVDGPWDSVDAGAYTTCGIRQGAIFCWGHLLSGTLGYHKQALDHSAPMRIGDRDDWDQVSVGFDHRCGLRTGALYCWGHNYRHALGYDTDPPGVLVEVPGKVGTARWSEIISGMFMNCGLQGGELHCWGDNQQGELGIGLTLSASYRADGPAIRVGQADDWDMVDVRSDHGCGLRSGALYCWGRNFEGQTGQPLTEREVLAPTQVGSSIRWTWVAVGDHDTCGIHAGALFCWGDTRAGELGVDGSEMSAQETLGLPADLRCEIAPTGVDRETPCPLRVDTRDDWDRVFAGRYHHCGLAGGALYCWGSNGDGRLGIGKTGGQHEPTRVGSASDWEDVALGDHHTCGIRGGELYCWGCNTDGQLGIGVRPEPLQSASYCPERERWPSPELVP